MGELKHLFFHHSTTLQRLNATAKVLMALNPFNYLDPKDILSRTVVSPIGIIHLYRQYFFELDSFLGSPVGHVWVAPHTTVELVEINTRRTLTESIIDESAFARVEQFQELRRKMRLVQKAVQAVGVSADKVRDHLRKKK